MNIGKLTLKKKTTYQLLIDNQTQYRRKYFVNVILSLTKNKNSTKIELQEYDTSKNYEYGFGITTGSSNLLSPSFNIKWDDIKDSSLYKKNNNNIAKILNFNKLLLMNKKDISQDENDNIASVFLKWIIDPENHIALHKEITDYLYTTFIENEKSGYDRPNRLIFSFKIKKDKTEVILYPGQIKEFRELYVSLSDLNVESSKENIGVCHACNCVKQLKGPYNIGLFTLDQSSFSIGFNGKKSTQYQVCNECYVYCNQGYNYIERNLKFKAYTLKKGKDYVDVFHYIIPLSTDFKTLEETLKQISRAKDKINEDYRAPIANRIKTISEGIRRADSSQTKVVQKQTMEVEKLEKDLERYNNNISFDIAELLEQLADIKLSIIDVFFTIVDNKQNPAVKEIVDVLIIDKTRIQYLAKTINEIKNEYGLSLVRLNDLKHLVGDLNYAKYLSRFMNGTYIDENQFIRKSSQAIKQSFKNEYFANERNFFSRKIMSFRVLYSLFEKSNFTN